MSSSSSSSRNTTVAQFREMIRTGQLALNKLEDYGANQKRMSIVPRSRGGGRLGNIQLGITPGVWKENPYHPECITTKWGIDWYERKKGAPETNKQKLDVVVHPGSDTAAMFEELDAWVRTELIAYSTNGSNPFGRPLKPDTVDVLRRGGLVVEEEYGEARVSSTVMVDKLKIDFWDPVARKLRKGMERSDLAAGSVFLATIRPTLVWFGWETKSDLKLKSWGVRWETDSIMAYHLAARDDVPPFDLDEETIASIRECGSENSGAPGDDGAPPPPSSSSSCKRNRGDDDVEGGGRSAKKPRGTEEESAATTPDEEEAWASVYPMP